MDWTQLLQGGAGGAMMGSMFGPWGTAIGGGLGLLGGLFGSQGAGSYQDQLKQLAQQYGSMQAPQMGPANLGQNSSFRTNQAGLISQLESMARGEGPSAANQTLQMAMDQAQASQASAAAGAGGRGVNAGAALRNAANTTAQMQSTAAGQGALARVNEQLGATSELGNVVNQARSADESMSQFNATQQNNNQQQNLAAKLQMLGITTPAQLNALQMAMQSAGPGFGTQMFAGGAMAMPGIMQYLNRQNNGNGGGYNPNYGEGYSVSGGPQPGNGAYPNYGG